MNLTIDLPAPKATAPEAQAKAAHMPTERYLARIVESALDSRRRDDRAALERHLDHIASKTLPETTPQGREAAVSEAPAAVRPQRNWHS